MVSEIRRGRVGKFWNGFENTKLSRAGNDVTRFSEPDGLAKGWLAEGVCGIA
jgi:hypothetical protein